MYPTKLYRAKIHTLYEGRQRPGEWKWDYTVARSVAQAGRFLRQRHPYPLYLVDDPVPDLRKK